MNKTQSKSERIIKEVISQIITHAANFQKLIKKNWSGVNNETLNKATKEYLTFLMYWAVFMMQENDLSKEELDEFHKAFYQKSTEKGLLEHNQLLDYEKLSRKRYMDFYQTLFQRNEEQLTGKKLNAVVAKEALYIKKLLSGFKEKGNAISKLYSELLTTHNELMLQIQFMFNSRVQIEK